MSLTKKNKPKPPPWKGWNKLSPNKTQRKEMMYKCGKKCFLGPKLSFPVCAKGTCKIDRKGLHSAYIRAVQWGKKQTIGISTQTKTKNASKSIYSSKKKSKAIIK